MTANSQNHNEQDQTLQPLSGCNAGSHTERSRRARESNLEARVCNSVNLIIHERAIKILQDELTPMSFIESGGYWILELEY